MSNSNRHSEAGKGSAPRRNVDTESYEKNYATVFGSNGWLERKKRQEQQLLEKNTQKF